MSDTKRVSKKLPSDALVLRKQAEQKTMDMEPSTLTTQSPEAIQQIVHELQVHQIELEMQNEELHQAYAEIEEMRNRYFDLYDLAPVGYTIISEKGLIMEANLTTSTLLSMNRSRLIKQAFTRFILKEDTDLYYLHRKKLFETGEPQSCELRLIRADGSDFFWARMDATVMKGSDGTSVCHLVLSDITKRKRADERLEYQRNHDFLTGLYNRGFLENEFLRLEDEQYLPVSLIIVDTNGLKLINDSFGHKLGDEVLRKTAESLNNNCRTHDIVARYGGDEFVMLLPNTTSAEAESRIKEIESTAGQVEIAAIQLTLSFGYQTRDTTLEDFAYIFKKAEDMMYRNKLYESSSAKSKTIGLVINSLFAKSDRESRHSKRVSALCEFIATKMNMSATEISRMRIAGLMHDIGKIGISEVVLNNQGKLTTEQWKEIKRHPEIGYRILAASSDFVDIATAILEHHEKWDGKGYPRGIAGESISLQARIITIADAYDAMTSERTYKQPMTIHDAIEEIRNCSGKHFDPQIASVFIDHYQEFTSRE